MILNDLIHQNYDQLSETDLAICQFIVNHKEQVGKMNVNDFAKKSLSSKSSVIRFSQKLGFSGYSELKNFIKWETSKTELVQETTFREQVLIDAEKTIKYIREADWTEIYQVIEKSKRIYLLSTGVTQRNQAKELRRLFMVLGKVVQIIPASDQAVEFKRVVDQLEKDDVLFLLSLSGENRSFEGILNILTLRHAPIISVTNFETNWLSGQSTYNLYARSSRSPRPQDWWLQTASTFFLLLESFVFGYVDYCRRNTGSGETKDI